MVRPIMHGMFSVLLAFAGMSSGMVLCIDHGGQVSIEAGCAQVRCSSAMPCAAEEAAGLPGNHQCCVDVPLPEMKLGKTAPLEEHKNTTVKRVPVFGAHRTCWPRAEMALRVTEAPREHRFPPAPAPGTIILLI